MEDLNIGADRLEDLLEMARKADSDFEKAAVFAATNTLETLFTKEWERGNLNGYGMEKVGSACVWICAIVGYETNNGHNDDTLAGFVYGDISSLKNSLEQQANDGA